MSPNCSRSRSARPAAYDVLATVLQAEADVTLAAPLAGQISMLRTNLGVLVEGVLAGSVTVECTRCLRPVTIPVTVALEEEFKPTVDVLRGAYVPVDEEDAALLIDEHHVLDISEVLRQAVLLEVPMQVLCRPDCAGLCQTCGQDLNEGPCDCPDEDIDRSLGATQRPARTISNSRTKGEKPCPRCQNVRFPRAAATAAAPMTPSASPAWSSAPSATASTWRTGSAPECGTYRGRAVLMAEEEK